MVVTLGTIAGINGVVHVTASAITRSYSPGTLSGGILWVPLGILALYDARRWLRPVVFIAAVAVGVVCLGIVFGVAGLLGGTKDDLLLRFGP